MKKIFTFLVAFTVSTLIFAQLPQNFSYQAIVRGANNALLSNQKVGIKISLLKGTENGQSVYSEVHTATTNANGLVSIAVGGGTFLEGNFIKIDWANGPYFVKTEIDPEGGTDYSLVTTTQLLSVPYALYAANSQPGPKGDKGEKGDQGPAGKDGLNGKDGVKPGEMSYWNGTAWVSIPPGSNNQNLTFCNGVPTWGPCPTLSIGEKYQGGVIAYIFKEGDLGYVPNETHGIISALNDLEYSPWGCFGISDLNIASGRKIGTGKTNTSEIINNCKENGIAAVKCSQLVIDGYNDWFLPSIEELKILYDNRSVIKGFSDIGYWSSTNAYSTLSLAILFNTSGNEYETNRDHSAYGVRAIRYF